MYVCNVCAHCWLSVVFIGTVIPKTSQPTPKPVVTSLPTTTRKPSTTSSTTTASTTTKPTTISTTPTTKQVTEPAVSIYFAKPFKNVTICVSGGTCKLICHVRGSKKKSVAIKWSKDNSVIQEGTPGIEVKRKNNKRSILILKNASKNNSGLYGCHATDPVSNQVINMFGKLLVEGKSTEETELVKSFPNKLVLP